MSISSQLNLDNRKWMSQSSVSYGVAPGQRNSLDRISKNNREYSGRKELGEWLVSLRRYIYYDGTFCGRTKLDLFKVIVFYLIFYTILALFLASLVTIFMFGTISNYRPRLTGDYSLLKNNPGLTIIPSPDRLTSLVYFKTGRKYSYRRYLDTLVAFTQWYEDHAGTKFSGTEISQSCDDRTSSEDYNSNKVCHFDLNIGGRCNIYDDFGYEDGVPCFAIKLNRIYGWLPEPLDNETGVIIKCDGLAPGDKNAMGELCYYDSDTLNKPIDFCKHDHGIIKQYYFPYLKQASYESPFVLIKFMNPRRKAVIMMQCHAIAKNIYVNVERRIGAMTFELLID